MCSAKRHVRFTPDSRHSRQILECPLSANQANDGKIQSAADMLSANRAKLKDKRSGAVQLAEATSSYSTSAVSCWAHSEQLNMSRSRPGVPVRAMSYSRIARLQLGHAGVLPIGCSDDLNKLNWGIAPLLALPTNSQQGNLFRDWFCHALREQLAGAHVRFGSKADMCSAQADVRFTPQ